jgi:hypothetical protein
MHRLHSIDFLLVAAAGLALGCEAPPNPVWETVLPIVGGSLATTCMWPTAVMTEGPTDCSGTLIHPRVVVTAKHCLVNTQGTVQKPNLAALGESSLDWARTVQISACFIHPTSDIGFCTLVQDVTDIPIVPVMAPCETSELKPGKAIVEVGFGVTSPTSRTDGIKKQIDGTIESISADQVDINVTTGSQDGEYYGDSGGPLFFRMPDRSWRLIGADCCSPSIVSASTAPRISTYTSVPKHVAWMEQQSGIDVTPCHDGNLWNPTAACTGFPTNPEMGVGSWATMCMGESLVRQPTCLGTVSDAGAGTDSADARAGSQDAAEVAVDAGLVDAYLGDVDSDDSSPDLGLVADTVRDTWVRDAATDNVDATGLGPDTWDGGYDGSAGAPGSLGSPDGYSADGDSSVSGGLDSEGRDDASEDIQPSGSMDSDRRNDAGLDSQPGGGNDSGAAGNDAADGGGIYRDVSADLASVSSDGASRPAPDSGGHALGGSGGCACRSISDRDSGSGLAWLAIGYLILRRSRRRFVV